MPSQPPNTPIPIPEPDVVRPPTPAETPEPDVPVGLPRRVLAWPKQVAEMVLAWFKRQTAELE